MMSQLPRGGAYNKEFYRSRKHLLAPEEEPKIGNTARKRCGLLTEGGGWGMIEGEGIL